MIIEQGGKQSVRSTAACLSSLALPTQASKQADLNFRGTAGSRRSRVRLAVDCYRNPLQTLRAEQQTTKLAGM